MEKEEREMERGSAFDGSLEKTVETRDRLGLCSIEDPQSIRVLCGLPSNRISLDSTFQFTIPPRHIHHGCE